MSWSCRDRITPSVQGRNGKGKIAVGWADGAGVIGGEISLDFVYVFMKLNCGRIPA